MGILPGDFVPVSTDAAILEQENPVRSVLLMLRRNLLLLLTIAAVALMLTLAFALLVRPTYTATARVMLDSRQTKVVDFKEVLSGLTADSNVVDTQVQVLRSRVLARRVVNDLHLLNNPEYNPKPKATKFFGLVPNNPAKVSEDELTDRVADKLISHLKVARSGSTYVIEVSYSSHSATESAAVANAFADDYLTEQLEAKYDATRRASEWLSSRLAGLRSQVESAERAVESYKSANGLLSAEGNNLTEQSISELNAQIASAKAGAAEAEARLSTARRQLQNGSNGEDVGEAINSPVVQQLRAQRGEVSRTVADLQGRYGPRHPDLLKAQRQLADIDEQIQVEVRRIISNLDAQTQVARQRANSLETSLGHYRGTLVSNNSASVRLNELERNAESVRTLYQSFLDRFKQTSAQEGIEQSDARILTNASVPQGATFPNIPLLGVMGLVLGLFLGGAVVYIREALDQGLSTVGDLERKLGLRHMASVPHVPSSVSGLDPIEYLVKKPLSQFAEGFRSMRESLPKNDAGSSFGTYLITSSAPAEGKSTTSICLSRTLALAGARVLLVDCDLRRPHLAKSLNQEVESGLTEAITGGCNWRDVVTLDPKSPLHLILNSDDSSPIHNIFSSREFARFVEEARAAYDYVILDSAPVSAVAETRALARLADSVIMVVKWRYVPVSLVSSSIKLLQSSGAKSIGAVLSNVDVRRASLYGYGEVSYHGSYAGYYTT